MSILRIAIRIAKHPGHYKGSKGYNIGLSVKQLLEKQFPGQKLNMPPDEIYKKILSAIGRYHGSDKEDIIQNLIEYIIKSGHDYSEGTDNISIAFNYFLNNLKKRAISQILREKTRVKTLAPEPEPEEEGFDIEDLEQVLDNEVDTRKFYKIMRAELFDFKQKLPYAQKKLFELIFEQNVGSFTTDIQENMGQAVAFKEYLQNDDDPMGVATVDRHNKRWSGFVLELRKGLLENMINYFEYEVSGPKMDVIYDQWN